MFSGNSLKIVPAGREDAPLLADIHRECFPHYWQPEAFTDFFSVEGTQALVALLPPLPPGEGRGEGPLAKGGPSSGASHLLLPKGEGEPAAMIVYRLSHEQADIITVAVRPAFRRRGIAAALVQEALNNASATGAEKLFLDVEETNAPAIALYEKFGFTLINRRKQYYRQTDGSFTDALVMQKKLA